MGRKAGRFCFPSIFFLSYLVLFFPPHFLYADSLLDPTSQYIHATIDACSVYSTGLDSVTRGLC